MTDTQNVPDNTQPPASGNAEVDQLVKRLRELGSKLTDENILNALIAQLSCHEPFIRLVRNLALEGLAEHVAAHSRDTPDIPTVHDNDQIRGYSARVHSSRNENTMLRVGIHSPHHPKHPNGLDIYAQRNGAVEQWDNLHLSPMAEQAIRQALAVANAEEGIYYWVELVVHTTHPVNEDTRPVGDGKAVEGFTHVLKTDSDETAPVSDQSATAESTDDRAE